MTCNDFIYLPSPLLWGSTYLINKTRLRVNIKLDDMTSPLHLTSDNDSYITNTGQRPLGSTARPFKLKFSGLRILKYDQYLLTEMIKHDLVSLDWDYYWTCDRQRSKRQRYIELDCEFVFFDLKPGHRF